MHRVAFTIFGTEILWYGVMTAIGFILGYITLMKNRKFSGLNEEQPATIMILAVVGGIVGARIFYVIQFWNEIYSKQPFYEVFNIRKGGQVFYGGFILTIILLFIYAKKNKIKLLSLLDIGCPSLAIGHAFGRIGCFLNGCCYGRPTDSIFGVIFPKNAEAYQKYGGAPIHPVQLYEFGMNLVLFLILMITLRKTKKGQTAAIYLVTYGILRYINESFFRGDHKEIAEGVLTKAEIVGLIIIPLGLGLFIYSQFKQSKSSELDIIKPLNNKKNQKKSIKKKNINKKK